MRFVKLTVESFRGIKRAELDFGPGLNVLYGPNDLGKSTLASAMRAALLLPTSSAEGTALAPWHADETPRVALTLIDDDGRYWQVKKSFSSGTKASAELHHSKDGVTFALDTRGREVEQKLRVILGWGVASPGGKGAPRGLPESFLAKVLLAEQGGVDAILGASLEEDQDESGRIRLQKALATLAQDPLFKHVLDASQAECDRYFTGSGRMRRDKGSPFVAVSEEIKKYEDERAELGRHRDASLELEQQVRDTRTAREEARIIKADAELRLEQAKAGLRNAQARQAADARVTLARQNVADIEAQVARLGDAKRARETLAKQREERHALAVQAESKIQQAEEDLRHAEEAHRAASGEDGEQRRKLRTAELQRELANIEVQTGQLAAQRAQIDQVLLAQEALNGAVRTADEARRKHDALTTQRGEAQARATRLTDEALLLRGVLAYGRWRAAEESAARAKQLEVDARAATLDAESKEHEGAALELEACGKEAELAARRAALPGRGDFRTLVELDRALERAEAALGGGLSITVRPKRPLGLEVIRDRLAAEQHVRTASELTFEADRSLRLHVEDLLELEVTAGAAEKRREVEELRKRWESEGAPVLDKSGVVSVSALEEAISSLEVQERGINELRARRSEALGGAHRHRERAALLMQQAESARIDPEKIAVAKAAVPELAQDILEARLRELGTNWEARGTAMEEQQARAADSARQTVAKIDQDLTLAEYQDAEAKRAVLACKTAVDAELVKLGAADPCVARERVQADTLELAARRLALESEVNSLAEEGSLALAKAESERQLALAALEAARKKCDEAREEVTQATATLAGKDAEIALQSELLARVDQAGALTELNAAVSELALLPATPLVTLEDLQHAQRALEQADRAAQDASEAYHKADGALSRAAGPALLERMGEAEAALASARARQLSLETEAQAWRLLHETLRSAENTEGAHLGRALAGPVEERFAELTSGRYAKLRFDPLLKAEGLALPGADNDADVLANLSVGTRDQLATLVRLTIARELRSAIVLDDHLVHTDPERLAWFREILTRSALESQILVLTCRAEDYLQSQALPAPGSALRDLAGGSVRAIDLERVIVRAFDAGVRTAGAAE